MTEKNIKPSIPLGDMQVGWAVVRKRKSLFKGQYFTTKLVGRNGEVIMVGETYTQRHSILELLTKYFPNFKVVNY